MFMRAWEDAVGLPGRLDHAVICQELHGLVEQSLSVRSTRSAIGLELLVRKIALNRVM
jgi:hypothetical protein